MRRLTGPGGLRAALATAWLLLSPLANAGEVLHEAGSPFGPVVVTAEGENLRALRFGRNGVRQSLVRLDDAGWLGLPYAPVTMAGLALVTAPSRFLVIGLGAGSLPAFLRRHYPAAEIDAVDINPVVAELARTHFGFREDARLQVHVDDGRRFIEAVQRPYDVIFLDAFGSDAVPGHLTTAEFLAAVRRALSPGGVAVGNLWITATRPPYAAMVQTYRAVFGELQVLRVAGSGNRILLALPEPRGLDRVSLAGRAQELGAEKRFHFDLGSLVDYGWLDTAPGDAAVLTDAALPR